MLRIALGKIYPIHTVLAFRVLLIDQSHRANILHPDMDQSDMIVLCPAHRDEKSTIVLILFSLSFIC